MTPNQKAVEMAKMKAIIQRSLAGESVNDLAVEFGMKAPLVRKMVDECRRVLMECA